MAITNVYLTRHQAVEFKDRKLNFNLIGKEYLGVKITDPEFIAHFQYLPSVEDVVPALAPRDYITITDANIDTSASVIGSVFNTSLDNYTREIRANYKVEKIGDSEVKNIFAELVKADGSSLPTPVIESLGTLLSGNISLYIPKDSFESKFKIKLTALSTPTMSEALSDVILYNNPNGEAPEIIGELTNDAIDLPTRVISADYKVTQKGVASLTNINVELITDSGASISPKVEKNLGTVLSGKVSLTLPSTATTGKYKLKMTATSFPPMTPVIGTALQYTAPSVPYVGGHIDNPAVNSLTRKATGIATVTAYNGATITNIKAELVKENGDSFTPKLEQDLGTTSPSNVDITIPETEGSQNVKLKLIVASTPAFTPELSSALTYTKTSVVGTITNAKFNDLISTFTANYSIAKTGSPNITSFTAELVKGDGTSLSPAITQNLGTTESGNIALQYLAVVAGDYKIKLSGDTIPAMAPVLSSAITYTPPAEIIITLSNEAFDEARRELKVTHAISSTAGNINAITAEIVKATDGSSLSPAISHIIPTNAPNGTVAIRLTNDLLMGENYKIKFFVATDALITKEELSQVISTTPSTPTVATLFKNDALDDDTRTVSLNYELKPLGTTTLQAVKAVLVEADLPYAELTPSVEQTLTTATTGSVSLVFPDTTADGAKFRVKMDYTTTPSVGFDTYSSTVLTYTAPSNPASLGGGIVPPTDGVTPPSGGASPATDSASTTR